MAAEGSNCLDPSTKELFCCLTGIIWVSLNPLNLNDNDTEAATDTKRETDRRYTAQWLSSVEGGEKRGREQG